MVGPDRNNTVARRITGFAPERSRESVELGLIAAQNSSRAIAVPRGQPTLAGAVAKLVAAEDVWL